MMVMRTFFVALCGGVWMVGCGSSTGSTETIADNLKGGQSAQHRSDASDSNENDGGVANGNGNGQGAHVGQGTGDGIDCKPADGGPSPCAQREGLEDAGKDDGSDKTRDAVVARARGAGDEPHILLFSLGYARFGGEGLAEMKRLADEAGGDFQQAESMVHLRDFFDAIATQMQESYVVRFPTSLDGAEHALRVEVDEKSAQRSAVYPSLARPLWPWLAAFGAALALVAVVLAVRARRPGGRIAILSGAKAGTVFALQPGRTRIGALEDNDIVLLSNAVSRYHAEITTRGRRASIADLRSKNGTRVNGQVIQETPLRAGDRIAIADVELLYDA